MLVEWFRHLVTPAPAAAKRLGYVRDLIAIEARHRRCRTSWEPHLQRSRRFVLKAADGLVLRDKVTVLGSGLLLDVPLAELSDAFTEVVLVDIVHMPAARTTAAAYANVRLVEADLTGLVEDIAAGRSVGTVATPTLPEGDADLVVSLNLITQLGVMLGRYGVDGPALAAAHLSALRVLPGRVALIGEAAREWRLASEVVESDRPLDHLDLPVPDETWIWDIAPAPELDRHRNRRFTIAGYADLSRISTRAAP